MMRFLSILTVAVLIWTASPQSAYAVGEDVFVVPRVAVQARADSATLAKNTAQREGRRRAMDILLRRLTVEEDWPRLPVMGAPATPDIADILEAPDDYLAPQPASISDDMLEELESGFEVYSEKSSSKTYRAYITYRFKPDQVRKLLKDAQIPYSEAQTRTALVIPVLQTGNGLYLWEENNPWMAAWKVRPYNNELTPLLAPLGDLEDSLNLTPNQAVAVDEAALSAIAARYSAPQVIIAHAFLQQQDGEDKLRVRFINGYVERHGFDTEIDVIDPGAGDLGAVDPIVGSEQSTVSRASQARAGEILAEAWFSQSSGNFPILAERAIEETIAKYAKPWKQRTLIDHTVAAFLNVSAIYNSIAEWGQIRSSLTSTPLVSAVQVRSLSRNGAEMVIQAFGDPEKLVIAMDAQGLVMWSEDEDYWTIATPAAAQRWQTIERRRGWFGQNGDTQSSVFPASYPAENDN